MTVPRVMPRAGPAAHHGTLSTRLKAWPTQRPGSGFPRAKQPGTRNRRSRGRERQVRGQRRAREQRQRGHRVLDRDRGQDRDCARQRTRRCVRIRRLRRRDGQCPVYEANAVVRGRQAAGGHEIGAHGAARRGRGAEAEHAVEGTRRVAVDEAAIAGFEARQRRAVDLARVIGGDCEGRGIDGERAAGESERIVRARRERALRDGVGADAGGGRRRCRQGAREDAGGVAVDQARVRVGQGRQRRAIRLGRIVGRHRQWRRRHRQRPADEVDRVVAPADNVPWLMP